MNIAQRVKINLGYSFERNNSARRKSRDSYVIVVYDNCNETRNVIIGNREENSMFCRKLSQLYNRRYNRY